MRLWHQSLITKLPRQQLLGLHREVCALRGKGWEKKHSTIDYIHKYDPAKLIIYHHLVIDEMEKRGYKVEYNWNKPAYRGKQLGFDSNFTTSTRITDEHVRVEKSEIIYPEHNEEYLRECIQNLYNKGVKI